MFEQREQAFSRSVLWAFAFVLALSVTAEGVTIWLIQEVRREQEIIGVVLKQLPADSSSGLRQLPSELKWQFWLSMLVLLNGIGMLVATIVLVRAYQASQSSLKDIKSIASDILASMDQAVITTDGDGIVTSLNPRTRTMYGVTQERRGRAIEELLPADNQLANLCRSVLESRESIHDRDVAIQRNGSTAYFRADCCPVHDADGHHQGTVIYVRDDSERVLFEERMRRMERYMGLGSLAAGLHHEIKNPLGALSLHVQLLDERLAELGSPDDVSEMLGVLKTEVTRINGVLENFRSFAAVSRLRSEPVQLRSLVDKMLQLVKPQADLQGVAFRVEQPQPLPELPLDSGRMEQVLLNLIVNALEAMPDGGTLTLRLREQDGQCLLEVQDTGPGIPDSIRDSVFDPYFTTKSNGMGMGLALCEKIIRQHDGDLNFETGERGTTFSIRLPVHGPVPVSTGTLETIATN